MAYSQGNSTISYPVSVSVSAGVQGGVVILLNGISLVLVQRNREISGRIKVCLVGQILTDLAVGVATIIMIIDNFQGVYCYISMYMNYIFGAVTTVMALLQSFDRFLILRFTYTYSAWISQKKMAVMVLAIYIIFSSLTFGLLYKPAVDGERCYLNTSGAKYGYIFMIVLVIFCSVTIISFYVYIGFKVRSHQKFARSQEQMKKRFHSNRRKVNPQEFIDPAEGSTRYTSDGHHVAIDVNGTAGAVELGSSTRYGGQNIREQDNNDATKSQKSENFDVKKISRFESRSEMKVMITLILTAGLYGLCYIPMSLSTIYITLHWDEREEYVKQHSSLITVCGILFTLNSVLNPLIYIWRLKTFRINWCKCFVRK